MGLACVAKQALEQKKKNREIILKLMRSMYFLAKNRIPDTSTYKELIELHVLAINCMKNILVSSVHIKIQC